LINQDSGAIALVGSGEYSVQMQELETELLHLAISRGKKNHFIQIPTASSHEGQSRREHWQSLGKAQSDRIGSHCIYLPIHEREDAFNPDFLDLIANAGLIYFSGGDPHRVAEIFSGSPLWEEIIKQWSTGTSLAGCSAGAMAFGGSIMGLRRSSHSPGLSLLPDIEVIPHYDKMLGWLPDRVASFVVRSDSQSVLLGIDEYTALVHTDSWRRVGRGKVHVLRGALEFEE
jgi:cyanophycinase